MTGVVHNLTMAETDHSQDEDADDAPGARGTDGKFAPGNRAAAGRKGARNRLSTSLLETLEKDFSKHGEAVVEIVRVNRPSEYLKVMAALVPKNVELEMDNPLAKLSPAEIADLLTLVNEMRVLEGTGAAS